jgi:hypothetical protein
MLFISSQELIVSVSYEGVSEYKMNDFCRLLLL